MMRSYIPVSATAPTGPGFLAKRGADASLPGREDALTTEEKRQRRRRDALRMKAKARRVYPNKAKAHYWADRLAVCSCAMCGNPRHVWKGESQTLQERKAAMRETDDS